MAKALDTSSEYVDRSSDASSFPNNQFAFFEHDHCMSSDARPLCDVKKEVKEEPPGEAEEPRPFVHDPWFPEEPKREVEEKMEEMEVKPPSKAVQPSIQKENDDGPQIMDNGQIKVENEEEQKESGETTDIMVEDDEEMNGESMVKKEQEKKVEQISTERIERRKRTQSTVRVSLATKNTPVKRISLDANRTDQTTSKKIVSTQGKMVDQARPLIQEDIHRIMDSPLSKMATAFGLKTKTVECPFCGESYGGRALDYHLREIHDAERKLKLFGCDKCNSWHRLPNNAMAHYREKGCKLRIRTLDEAKDDMMNTPLSKPIQQDNHRIMDSPLSKMAAAFGLKTNTVECPFCEETFGIGGALGDHITTMHNEEGQLKLFGCDKCNSWYGLSRDAMQHHSRKGCKLSIRPVDEAKSQMMNIPLTKTANVFGLKTNTVECPYCGGTFGIGGALDGHIRTMHNEEAHVKLFGCDKCNSWYELPKGAMAHHYKKGCKLRVLTIDEAKNQIMNIPLSKAAHAFGLKTNTVECPYCGGTFGIGGSLGDHIKKEHNAEKIVELFGCENCNSWHTSPTSAMVQHREKGCKLRIRSVDEAKKMNTSHQRNDVNDSEGFEAEFHDFGIDSCDVDGCH